MRIVSAILLMVTLSSCARAPTPFVLGSETDPLPGCVVFKQRGGEC